jgi:hypothetical protein
MWAWGFFGQTTRIVITSVYGAFVLSFVTIAFFSLATLEKTVVSNGPLICQDDSKDKNVLPCTSSSSFSSSWSS